MLAARMACFLPCHYGLSTGLLTAFVQRKVPSLRWAVVVMAVLCAAVVCVMYNQMSLLLRTACRRDTACDLQRSWPGRSA